MRSPPVAITTSRLDLPTTSFQIAAAPQRVGERNLNRNGRGRQFFFNPGPTNIPDRVLRAMDRATLDFLSEEFLEIHSACHEGLKRVLKTRQHLFVYAATGHGAWEAGLVNLFSPGERLLILESGYFSEDWALMARRLGLDVEVLKADWRVGVAPADLEQRLVADKGHAIRAVLVVHNETATGLANPVAEFRHAIDRAGHPALYLVDTISSLGCFDFRMDEWGVDVAVGGSQKGLMIPTGLSFSGVSEKALAASRTAKLPRHYWDWEMMQARAPQRFCGTTPVHLFFGLAESLRMIEEEGLDAIFRRHARLARATREAARVWHANGSGPELFCRAPQRLSDSVTALIMPEGHDAETFRRTAINRFNLSLGGGLGPLLGRVFRIGHMGELNEPMLLGALATVELALKESNVPHGPGGVEAAIAALANR
ncbi:MAG: aminotransferase class V-fold PLP-dependent enzyme [Alphaproteobacteria bacterium]|nr:aminotransferase class V-fold PLP-dependent enzyme [Alphaproteobacteria bacterium]